MSEHESIGKHPGGRPLKFNSVEDLKLACDLYFFMCEYEDELDKEGNAILKKLSEPLTITGLALALKTSRQTLMNYEAREEFFDTIKEAKLRVENYAEKRLFTGKATGPIFALKNFGWEDTQKRENLYPDGVAVNHITNVKE
jgi:hypothetical protein